VRSYCPGLTAGQVRHRLEATADHPSDDLPDPLVGYGLVDPAAAVAAALPEESGDPAPQPIPQPIRVPAIAPPDPAPARIALTSSAMLVAAVGLGAVFAATLTRGHRHRWRPADRRGERTHNVRTRRSTPDTMPAPATAPGLLLAHRAIRQARQRKPPRRAQGRPWPHISPIHPNWTDHIRAMLPRRRRPRRRSDAGPAELWADRGRRTS